MLLDSNPVLFCFDILSGYSGHHFSCRRISIRQLQLLPEEMQTGRFSVSVNIFRFRPEWYISTIIIVETDIPFRSKTLNIFTLKTNSYIYLIGDLMTPGLIKKKTTQQLIPTHHCNCFYHVHSGKKQQRWEWRKVKKPKSGHLGAFWGPTGAKPPKTADFF